MNSSPQKLNDLLSAHKKINENISNYDMSTYESIMNNLNISQKTKEFEIAKNELKKTNDIMEIINNLSSKKSMMI